MKSLDPAGGLPPPNYRRFKFAVIGEASSNAMGPTPANLNRR
jgi:hypothetical protein